MTPLVTWVVVEQPLISDVPRELRPSFHLIVSSPNRDARGIAAASHPRIGRHTAREQNATD